MSAPQQLLASFGASWTPSQLSGKLLWCSTRPPYAFNDAGSTAVTAGDGIYTLTDRAASAGDRTQTTSGARPIYRASPSRAEFDGARYWSGFTLSLPGLFSAHKFRTSTAGYHNLYDTHPSSTVMLWVDSGGKLEPDTTSWASGPSVTDGAWHTAFVWRSNTDATRLWVDGTEYSGSGFSRTVTGTCALFNRGGAAAFVGDCEEFIFASSLPSTGDLASLHGYLAAL